MEQLLKFILTQADPECSKWSDKLYGTIIILHISLYSVLTMNIWVLSSSALSNVTNACYMFILSFLSPGEDVSTV